MIREHKRGRPLAEILEDSYVTNRLTPEQIERLLDRPEVIHAVGDDMIAALKRGIARRAPPLRAHILVAAPTARGCTRRHCQEPGRSRRRSPGKVRTALGPCAAPRRSLTMRRGPDQPPNRRRSAVETRERSKRANMAARFELRPLPVGTAQRSRDARSAASTPKEQRDDNA